MGVIETVRVKSKFTKSGFMTINKSDFTNRYEIYEELRPELKPEIKAEMKEIKEEVEIKTPSKRGKRENK